MAISIHCWLTALISTSANPIRPTLTVPDIRFSHSHKVHKEFNVPVAQVRVQSVFKLNIIVLFNLYYYLFILIVK